MRGGPSFLGSTVQQVCRLVVRGLRLADCSGCAVITTKAAFLFTDGRYFLQAEQQLDQCVLSTRSLIVTNSLQELDVDETRPARRTDMARLSVKGACVRHIPYPADLLPEPRKLAPHRHRPDSYLGWYALSHSTTLPLITLITQSTQRTSRNPSPPSAPHSCLSLTTSSISCGPKTARADRTPPSRTWTPSTPGKGMWRRSHVCVRSCGRRRQRDSW